jgi:D-alanyl-D-alanine carboxypeptidase/D-alanyl-D-alanine-endopeptidase (penicillin-binding protein 4)
MPSVISELLGDLAIRSRAVTAAVVLYAAIAAGSAAGGSSAATGGSSGAGPTGNTGPTGAPVITPAPNGVVSPTLRAKLKGILRSVGGSSGVYIYDITAGKPLTGKKSTTRRILASNAKLFTTAAALDQFGLDGRFATRIYTDGTIAGGIVNGNVFIRGGGDPTFGSDSYAKRHYSSAATIEQLAGKLALSGVTQITGGVYGDETAFDSRRGTAKYGFRRSGEIGGQLSGLAFDRGLTTSGRAWQTDPPRYAATKLREELQDAGVDVDGAIGVRVAPVGATELAAIESLAMSRLISLTNKPSNNFLSEMLLKGLALNDQGKAGSTPATTGRGASLARLFAASLRSRVSLGDGSGLSRTDRAAPREVVDLLRGMQNRVDFPQYYASLSVPGVDGTLYKRMRGTAASKRCAAKTGTLSNVSALSGYCTTAQGHIAAFSILQNNVWPGGAHSVQNRIVTTLAAVK